MELVVREGMQKASPRVYMLTMALGLSCQCKVRSIEVAYGYSRTKAHHSWVHSMHFMALAVYALASFPSFRMCLSMHQAPHSSQAGVAQCWAQCRAQCRAQNLFHQNR